MVILTATPRWDDVPQIETNTPLKGGPSGPLNVQAQALLNRTELALRAAMSTQMNTGLRAGQRPMIIAHRGFDSVYPQNTLLAYSSAMRSGADGIELDVSFSADGVAYCYHDDTVDSLTNGTGSFVTLQSAYIDTLTYKALAGTIYQDLGVTKFADVLAWGRKIGVPMYVELKQVSNSGQVQGLIAMIVAARMEHLISAQSGYMPNVAAFRAANADINVGFIAGDSNYAPYVDQLSLLGNATLLTSHDAVYAAPATVAYCAKYGVDLSVYTIPDTYYLNRIAAIGVSKFVCSRFARGTR